MAGKKNKRSNEGAIVILAIVVVLAIFALILAHNSNSQKTSSGDYVTGATYPEGYDSDLCTCLERNRPTCLDNFYYNETRGLCVNPVEKTVTYAHAGCSLYECPRANYTFDLDNKEWLEVTS